MELNLVKPTFDRFMFLGKKTRKVSMLKCFLLPPFIFFERSITGFH